MSRDKAVILILFALAIAGGSIAIWYHYDQGRYVRVLWGPAAASTVRNSQHVELLVLDPTRVPPDLSDTTWPDWLASAVTARHDLTAARGLIHVRHALLVDASYEQPVSSSTSSPHWHYALHFIRQADPPTYVLLDLEDRWLVVSSTGQRARLGVAMASGLRRWLSESAPQKLGQ